jgi:hypothetical protein
LQLGYAFSLNWQPIYRIGNPYPTEVKFLGGIEEFSFVSEYEKRVTNTGEFFESKYTDFDIIEINPLSQTWIAGASPLILYPCSGKITSNRVSIQEDNLVVQETAVIKYY